MYVKLSFHIDFDSEEYVNLVEYGHDPATTWDELTDEQKNLVKEGFEEQKSVYASGEHLCPILSSSAYSDEDLEELEELGLIE